MSRRRIATALAALLLVAQVTGAWADELVGGSRDGRNVVADATVRGPDGAEISVATLVMTPPEHVSGDLVLRPHPEPDPEVEGPQQCWYLRVTVHEDAAAAEAARGNAGPQSVIASQNPRCPNDDIAAQLRAAAERQVRSWPMPQPTPWVAPGEAITGIPSFLEPGGQTTMTVNTEFVLGELAITARTVAYDVAWGDGHAERYSGMGGPYPNGDIVYTYAEVGVYDVLVTQWWTADWSYHGALGSFNGRVTGLWSQSSIPDFDVGQIQAVRIR